MSVEDKATEEIEQEEWLITYADAVTLLMAFFVMLLSMSTLDPKKYEEVSKGISSGFMKARISKEVSAEEMAKKHIDNIFKAIKASIEKYAAQNKISDQLQVSMDQDGLRIINNDPYLFKPGQAELSKHSSYFLNRVYRLLKSYPFIVYVEGHTDNVPVKSTLFKSNWELSSARAIDLIHGLEKLGLPSKRFVAMGYGPYRPIASNKSEKGRALNRRIVLLIDKVEAEEMVKLLLEKKRAKKREKAQKKKQQKLDKN